MFRQEIGSDVLPITLERRGESIVGQMKQAPLKLLRVLEDMSPLALALGIGEHDILRTPPPRVADTGGNHLLVRLIDRSAIDRVRPDHGLLLPILRDLGAEGCYVFAHVTADPGNAYTRFFNPRVGLWEDSATGTAAGPLCGYLGWAGLLGPERTLRVEQGVQMGRRSILEVKLTPDPVVSGGGAVVLEGDMLLPA
jgi:PhzF family phenazine biosynthesis protein